MKRIVAILLMGLGVCTGIDRYRASHYPKPESQQSTAAPDAVAQNAPPAGSSQDAFSHPAPLAEILFSCDGRTRCSQMTSCAEATYFLQHCPGVRMDGDHDGVPCEDQWCRN